MEHAPEVSPFVLSKDLKMAFSHLQKQDRYSLVSSLKKGITGQRVSLRTPHMDPRLSSEYQACARVLLHDLRYAAGLEITDDSEKQRTIQITTEAGHLLIEQVTQALQAEKETISIAHMAKQPKRR